MYVYLYYNYHNLHVVLGLFSQNEKIYLLLLKELFNFKLTQLKQTQTRSLPWYPSGCISSSSPLHHQPLVSPLWMQSVHPSGSCYTVILPRCHHSIISGVSEIVFGSSTSHSLLYVWYCWNWPEASMAYGVMLHSHGILLPLSVFIQHCSLLGNILEMLGLFGCVCSRS